MRQDLAPILEGFGGEGQLSARMVTGRDGQSFIQLRIDLGALQMHLDGRPDGDRPFRKPTLLGYLDEKVHASGAGQKLPSANQWEGLDREIMQFYHRRIALLTLGDKELESGRDEQAAECFRRALRDAEHNLRGLDFIRRYHADARFIAGHEQYRTFVLANCGLAASKFAVARHDAEEAIEQLKHWQSTIRRVYAEQDAEKDAERDEALAELRRYERLLRQEHNLPRTLQERLADAVSAERFEEAARLRDELRARQSAREPEGEASGGGSSRAPGPAGEGP